MISLLEKDIDSFFEVPFNVYENSHFVSLFKDDIKRFLSTGNPLFRKGDNYSYFTAIENNKAIGRIVVLIHPDSNKRHDLNWAYIGYFDCADRMDVAKLLMNKALEWAKLKGAQEIVGNINFTFMQQIGVVVKGYEHFPYSDQVYNPPHIAELYKKLGFESFFPMVTSEADLTKVDLKVFEKDKIKLI